MSEPTHGPIADLRALDPYLIEYGDSAQTLVVIDVESRVWSILGDEYGDWFAHSIAHEDDADTSPFHLENAPIVYPVRLMTAAVDPGNVGSWWDVLRTPSRSNTIAAVAQLRREALDAQALLETKMHDALEEADYARLLLSIAITQAGGALTITDSQLAKIWGHPTITSEHDSEDRVTTFRIGTR